MLTDGKLIFAEDTMYTMEDTNLMEVWNNYCENAGEEYTIHVNSEESVHELLNDLTPQQILLMGKYTDYDECDEYVTFDGEEITSADTVSSLIDEKDHMDFLQYLIENEITDDALLQGFIEYFFDNTSHDFEDSDSDICVEDYLEKLDNDIYEWIRTEDWDSIVEDVDNEIDEDCDDDEDDEI